jgi:hypothetical protein
VVEAVGTLELEHLESQTNYHKGFRARLADAQEIRMNCWGKCNYGRGGGMTSVRLGVTAKARLGDDTVTVSNSAAIYGLSP